MQRLKRAEDGNKKLADTLGIVRKYRGDGLWRQLMAVVSGCACVLLIGLAFATQGRADPLRGPVDTALVVSVDVSSSVDNRRYDLQLQGIAAALEDKGVQQAILNGPRGAILFALVTWSDNPKQDVPWTRISSPEDARRVARLVRNVPRNKGNFTCMGTMMRFLGNKVLAQIPVQTFRSVIDVSGDGKDNCNPSQSIASIRDELIGFGAIINGLPILEGREANTLQSWYTENVKGGLGSFILPAAGFADFGRAIRQKFVIEISGYDDAPNTVETAARLSPLR
ncbi:MAG: DUF1194 domain-containing protein [Hyphomicrobiaceae bacterium]